MLGLILWWKKRRALPCRCGHPEIAHQHHRAGTDCSDPVCECISFRRPWRTGGYSGVLLEP